MKNNVFKKLIASLLTLGILMSGVSVFAVDDNVDVSGEITSMVDENTSVTDNNSLNDSDEEDSSEPEKEPTITYSTASENGINDNSVSAYSLNVTWNGSVPNSAEPMGSQANPYAVSDVEHFLDMSRLINEDTNQNKYFKLTSDIDLSGVDIDDITSAAAHGLANTIVSVDPTKDGSDNIFFVLDGSIDNSNGRRKISGLNISDDSRNSLAIFGYLNSLSTLKNIYFEDITLDSDYSSTVALGVILLNSGTVSNCGFKNINISTVSNNTDDAFAPIAGSDFRIYSGMAAAIVDNRGTFTQQTLISDQISMNTTTNINVTSTGNRPYIGGIIAQNRGYVNKTRALNVKVNANANSEYVGGFVASNLTSSSSTTTGLYYTTLTLADNGVKGGDFTGALCGNNTGRINYCSVTGKNNIKQGVTSSQYDIYMYGSKTYGGIAASNSGIIDKCDALNIGVYYSDSVSEGIYGGISGTNSYTVQNCVSTGLVVASDSTIDIFAGGVIGVGTNSSRFYVGNCFTLVKLPETTAILGSVIGIDGDEPYNNNKVRNCYYSSVVSFCPSPVSYGGTGESYGDLQYNISYFGTASGAANKRTIDFSDFTYSGWPGTSFALTGTGTSFYRETGVTNVLSVSVNVEEQNVTITPGSTFNVAQTVYYDTNITLPSGIGNVSGENSLVISSQPLALRVMIKSTPWNGNGTISSPYVIQAQQLSLIKAVPYGHFKFADNATVTFNDQYWSSPISFWGTLDGGGSTLSSTATMPMFKGIYGSRNNSSPQNNSSTHTSDPNSDSSSNTEYGVVKNLVFDYRTASSTPALSFFGNICNATVSDVSFVSSQSRTFNPNKSNIGVAVDTVYGNSYLYNVYNDSINVVIDNNVNAISGLIGTIDAQNAIIDNCGSSCIITGNLANMTIRECSAFIGNIKSISGAVQNCYSSGGVKAGPSSVTVAGDNYLFAAKSNSSVGIYNCLYSPTNYYESNKKGITKPIPDGAYTGSLTLWGFQNSMYVIALNDSDSLRTKAVVNINRFDNDTYAAQGSGVGNLATTYFTPTISGTGYTCSRVSYTTTVTALINVSATASDSADVLLKHNATKLVARAGIASSSDIDRDGDVYLIKKPMDLYTICQNQASSATDNGRYLSSEYEFRLEADIDMTGFTIDPWGRDTSYPFCGTITGEVNGDGTPKYTISGLTLSSNYTCGLFGYVDGATITGIGIADSTVSGGQYTGALVGQIMTSAVIANCKVSSSTVTGKARVGGLIGGIFSSASSNTGLETVISECFVNSTSITANTTQEMNLPSMCGGIIGCVGASGMSQEPKYADISECSVNGCEISATYYQVGGIVGVAACENNTLTGCTVNSTSVLSSYSSASTAAVGGIAGSFGGSALGGDSSAHNVVSNSTVSGENAAGIVSRIVNFNAASTVSYCDVISTEITGVGYAGGITAYIGAFSGLHPYSNKVITYCKTDADTVVTAKVAGGIVGVVMSDYDNRVLNVNNTHSYATVTTTGDKGSKIEGAGGFIGRLATGLDTSGITLNNCISGGNIVGSAVLGGVIALFNSDTSSTPIVSNCYITTAITQKSIKATKGLIIGLVGDNNKNNLSNVVSNAVFSSFTSSVAPYGNVTDTSASTYTDVNMGANGTDGITVTASSATVRSNCVVSGEGTNCITLKENIAGNVNNSPNSATNFTLDNLPSVSGFSFVAVAKNAQNRDLYWGSSNETKLALSSNPTYNSCTSTRKVVSMATYTYKGRVSVYTYYDGNIGGETVRFTIGFTVICSGTHKFDGAGTDVDPYKIYDAEDLIAIKEHHDSPLSGEDGNSFYTASYVLMNDIDLSEVCVDNNNSLSFPSIGSLDAPFKGSITSNGSLNYTIRNLFISPSTHSNWAGNTSEHNGYSDAYGLFGYMQDAELSNINFENAEIVGGTSSGVVAGSVKNTDISNVTISGDVSVEDCATGGGLVGVSTGELNANNITVDGISVSAQTNAGGILGYGAQCAGSTVSNFNVTGCTVTSTALSGTYYAGAVAGQMDGVVSGVYENNELVSAGNITNCTVSGVVVGGAVGGGSANGGNNDYSLTIQGVNVTNTTVNSTRQSNNSVAGGILGKTVDSYEYLIKDCTVDSSSSCSAYYAVGGIVGSVGVASSMYYSSFDVKNCKAYASLVQNVTNISLIYGGDRKIAGVGGVIGVIAPSSDLRQNDNTATVKVADCIVGGTYSGSINVGCIIGQIGTQNSIYMNRVTEPIISNCTVLSSITKVGSENHDRFGIVVGAVEGNVSNSDANPFMDDDNYACHPFINVFYSSYMTSSDVRLFGDSAFYNYQNIDMGEYVYDLNNINWKFTKDGNNVDLPIVVYERFSYNPFNSTKFYFSNDLTTKLGTSLSGNIIDGFTVAGKTVNNYTVNSSSFNVQNIYSPDLDLYSVNNKLYFKEDSNHQNCLYCDDYNGTTPLVFEYQNGLKISIDIICGVQYDGEGTVDDPILVSSEEIFNYIVPTLPGYYFKQTKDLDEFYKTTKATTSVINNFTGHYDGQGYKLKNITLNVQDTVEGGLFGNVSGVLTDGNDNVIPNIENLIIEDCTINAQNCTTAGILAASVSNGASISNVIVKDSSVEAISPVGGIVGAVDGASKVENCTVEGSTVATSSGCAGGIAGVMNNVSGEINSCYVYDSTVSSGNASALDIAGGIVAQAVGTVNGRTTSVNNVISLLDSVKDTEISAYYCGGAVGANQFSNASADLTINNVKVSSTSSSVKTSVTASYSGLNENPCAAGILAVIFGDYDCHADISVNNCYVSKNTAVSSQYAASGCVGLPRNYVDSIEITDSEAYANVNASEKVNTKRAFAGGLIAVCAGNVNPNVIEMDGCVGGGNVTANGWKSYAGGAIGFIEIGANNYTINDTLFVNGVLSASVSASIGSDSSMNPVNCYGKFLGGMDSASLFTDNSDFSTVVFHDNYYSSYPQDINFFGMNEIDKFNSITPKESPFEDINSDSNFTISSSSAGPWNPIAIAKDLNVSKTFYVKFVEGMTSLTFAGGRKISNVDVNGFSIEGTNSEGNAIFELDSTEPMQEHYDAGTGTYYSFGIIPKNSGAGRVGAAYDCGLATSLPILCVDIQGTGAQNDPYLISNPIQLYVVGYLLSSNTYFLQTQDIDLTNTYKSSSTDNNEVINYNGGKAFSPIGSLATPFCGNYDGGGYKIKGLYINRGSQANVGLFGCVKSESATSPAVLQNIHIELLESDSVNGHTNGILGGENTAGLVGNVYGTNSTAQIINCSVSRSTVIGSNNVGALCGMVGDNVSISGSFTESDVYSASAGSYAGGLVGEVNAGLSLNTSINKCLSSSNVYAQTNANDNTIGNAGGLVGRVTKGSSSMTNCLFTGTTNSGHGVYADMSMTNNTTFNVSSVIDAGRDTSMSNGRFYRVNTAAYGGAVNTNVSNVYYDSAVLKAANVPTGVTGKMTSELIGDISLNGISSSDWNFVSGSYPIPKVNASDAYSASYASLLSSPVMTSESEEINDSSEPMYGRGLIYPVSLPQNVSSTKVTYSSSVFDTTDTVPYPAGYDTALYGIGANKNTDLLFEDIDSTGNTTVYRNIFKQDTGSDTNHRISNLTGGACLANGEVMYNLQMPVIFAQVTIGSVTYYREIKLSLSYENTYCISTQRQLFALGLADYETSQQGSKFSDFYGSDYNYKLITDITVSPENTTVFTPIGLNDIGGYTGEFNGNHHSVTNLTIGVTGNKPSGMFSVLGDGASVNGLSLVNPSVTGQDYVGAVVGRSTGALASITDCSVIGGSVVASGSYVGGLAGSVESNSTVSSCNSSASVSGAKDSIGGLIGQSTCTVTSCYATGDVSTHKMTSTGGIGGLIGHIVRGRVTYSFASGSVTVEDFTDIITTSKTYGIGGFVGIAEKNSSSSNDGITCCFSGGNVSFGTQVTGGVKPAMGNVATVGIGGFSGVSSTPVTNCYSSAAVSASIDSVYNQGDAATFIVGVAGVCGVVFAQVQNVYSSGSVSEPNINDFDDIKGTVYYGVGGAVGTRKQNTSVSVSNAYFDLWTNTDSTLTAIGDEQDTSSCKSFTTQQLTSGSNPGGFDPLYWGFVQGAYPYLNDLLNEGVSSEVKVNSILSVLVVEPDEEDYSARSGNGITMALTVPTEFRYYDRSTGGTVSYNLHWAGANMSGNQAAPVRTRNTSEFITLTAEVVGLEQYGSRQYERICADMRGTYRQPYLIGSLEDYEHINMTASEQQIANTLYPEFYGQWATPIDEHNQQIEATVYYQLMINLDVSNSTRSFSDLTGTQYSYDVSYYDTNSVLQNETRSFDYSGFVLMGNSYTISNASATGAYFPTLDSNSIISNVAFKDVSFAAGTNTALIGTNSGALFDITVSGNIAAGNGYTAGIAAVNNGSLDGCVADISISNANSNVGGLVGLNTSAATINNCASDGTLTVTSSTPSVVGSFVASNNGSITNSFSMGDLSCAGGGVASAIGGFAGMNVNGNINACFTRSSITFPANSAPANSSTVGLLAGELSGGSVTNCFTSGNLRCYATSVNFIHDSIAFGSFTNNPSVSAIYVDKAMAGRTSADSVKYSIMTKYLIEMDTRLVDSSMRDYFTADTEETHYPSLTSIDEAENTQRVDDNDEIVIFDEGTIIRNYNVLKAYAKVAKFAITTKNGMYIDALPLNSNGIGFNCTVSYDDDITRNISNTSVVNLSYETLSTTDLAGESVLSASTTVNLRQSTFTPALNIALVTGVDNPNFASGDLGTASKPYRISSPAGLQSLYYYGPDPDIYYQQNGTINCDGFSFEQIPYFAGKIHKRATNADWPQSSNRAILNVDVNGGGIFGTIGQGAYLSTLSIVGARITDTSDTQTNSYTGILADRIEGATIKTVIVTGEVNVNENPNSSSENDAVNTSGILAGIVSSSTISGIVTSGYIKGREVVGGVAGALDSTNMQDVLSTTYVDGISDVGGIAGQIVNSSILDDIIFAGSCTGCAITSNISNNSTITDYYVDYQLNISDALIGSQQIDSSHLKSTQALTNVFSDSITGFNVSGGRYIVPSSLAITTNRQTSPVCAAVEMAARTVNIRNGASIGTISRYTTITFDRTIRAHKFNSSTQVDNVIRGAEVVESYGSESTGYLNIIDDTQHNDIRVSIGAYDSDVDAAALKLYLDTDNNGGTIFKSSSPERVFRYVTPGMVKSVNISYTLTDTTNELSGESVGILFRGLSDAAGVSVENTNVFDVVGTAAEQIDTISVAPVASNGFYVADMLPAGYKFNITAVDIKNNAANNELTVSSNISQTGAFIDLTNAQTSDIRLNISIVRSTDTPWGVNDRKSTIW